MMNAATPLFVHNLILILLILYSGKLLVASEDINCDVRVQEGQCVTNPSYVSFLVATAVRYMYTLTGPYSTYYNSFHHHVLLYNHVTER